MSNHWAAKLLGLTACVLISVRPTVAPASALCADLLDAEGVTRRIADTYELLIESAEPPLTLEEWQLLESSKDPFRFDQRLLFSSTRMALAQALTTLKSIASERKPDWLQVKEAITHRLQRVYDCGQDFYYSEPLGALPLYKDLSSTIYNSFPRYGESMRLVLSPDENHAITFLREKLVPKFISTDIW